MFRTLYIKLVLILILLIVSLMSIVGVFLINGVSQFYMNEFSRQMSAAFSDNENFSGSLLKAAGGGAPAREMTNVVRSNSHLLGVDGRERFFFILDGRAGQVLGSPYMDKSAWVDLTPNVLSALDGRPGNTLTLADRIFDCAVPLDAEDGQRYIVYIYDTRESLRRLSASLVTIVVEAVIFGLAISIMLALLLSKTMTTPIESLTRSASRVADGDFSHMPESASSDEIGVLTRTFSHMAHVLRVTLEDVGNERDKLDTLFQHMADGMLAFTRGGELLHVNPAAVRLLGISDSQSADFQSLLGDVAPLEDLSGLTPPGYVEKRMERGDGHFRVFFAPFGGAGPDGSADIREGGIMAVIHDVTEQIRLDNVRREFVSNVSHELRTPLTNVLSYAETLTDNELPPDTVRNFSGVIVGEANRMTRIVQDLLTLSKFDYGKMDWRVSRVDIAVLLTGVRQAMLMDAGRRGLNLTLETEGELPPLCGDRQRLEQVLFNIVSNALAYTPEGGDVSLRARHQDGNIIIRVTDTGAGIPKDEIDRLFERFYRVDKARSREQGGTGLGLSIAREIVRRHNGHIRIDSELGQGTTVNITLPVDNEQMELWDEGDV